MQNTDQNLSEQTSKTVDKGKNYFPRDPNADEELHKDVHKSDSHHKETKGDISKHPIPKQDLKKADQFPPDVVTK